MSVEVTMPQMGESVVEGTIVKWLVKEGDRVAADQTLCEISTDKVDTEIPSPVAGVILNLVANEGDTIPVGALLAVLEPEGKAAPAPAPEAKPAPPPPPPEPEKRVAPAAGPDGGPSQAAPRPPAVGGEHRRYSPVVLKIAAEEGIDPSRVPGSGAGGRVSKRDVLRYLDSLRSGGAPPKAPQPRDAAQAAAAPRPAASGAPRVATPAAATAFHPPVYEPREEDAVEPFSRRRKFIAEHMVYSKTHAPHVGTVAEVDVTKLARFRHVRRDEFLKREGFSLTMLPLAAAASVRALKEFPRMNASVVGDSLVIRRQINLGIAMDSEEGLLVPVIKAAEGMSVVGLAREIERLRRRVAEKSITADDLAGGSFTLSNPGREGNLYGFAIINQPQVGILRMGEIKKRPVVVEADGAEAIAVREMMYLALSYDHRVIDGVLANRFLYRVARLLGESDFEL
jgi:pyruvate/2-oxoglutarate dehydrogenase complex dihydrolipoamide acyltransferase (E2) component